MNRSFVRWTQRRDGGQTVIFNLGFIKAPNGLFHFSMDYLAALEGFVDRVLVRSPPLAAAVQARFPWASPEVVTGVQAFLVGRKAARRGTMVFTPSSHPVPWCDRQLIVLHDTFPFRGRRGTLKALLFRLSLHTSTCRIGFVNRSDARAYLIAAGIAGERLISTPNRMTLPSRRPQGGAIRLSQAPVIGLFGTDSPKKNYEALFCDIVRNEPTVLLDIRLYGQRNDYADALVRDFPTLGISITDSSQVAIEGFIESIELVASAATSEGFSRPTALALATGVPAWVVDSPVYREFYNGAAVFHENTMALAKALSRLEPDALLTRPHFCLSEQVEIDFQQALALLRYTDEASR